MATIQIKRRTTSGTGPLIGSGTIKAGEPLIDLNGGHLYIAKADKTNSITAADYIEFLDAASAKSYTDSKVSASIAALGLKSASKYAAGSGAGCVPVIDSDGKLKSTIIPKIAITDTYVVASQAAMLALSSAQIGDIAVRTDVNKSFILKEDGASTLSHWQELLTPLDKVQSVNGKTGAVTITLSELGGVSTSSFNSHTSSNVHLTDAQKSKLANMYNTDMKYGSSNSAIASSSSASSLASECISGGLKIFQSVNSGYNPNIKSVYLGIDKSKVLTPSSNIDGGTY